MELVQIAVDLAGSLDPREVIARVLERGTHAVQADRATLSSLTGDAIVIEATYGRAGALTWVGQRYSLDYFAGQPLVQRAIETRQPTFGGPAGGGQCGAGVPAGALRSPAYGGHAAGARQPGDRPAGLEPLRGSSLHR